MSPTIFEGLRVVDLTHGFGGPLATMILGDNGAEVTRIVAPSDSAYRGDPCGHLGGTAQWHRGKRTVEADLKTDDGQRRVHDLIDESDILVESFRPGVLNRIGLGYDQLAGGNPALVYCSLTGFGRSGPWRDLPAYEGIVTARCGKMADFGRMFGYDRPAVVAPPIAGFAACQALLQGLCGALIVRQQTGVGQYVEASMLRGLGPHDIVDSFVGAQVAAAAGASTGRPRQMPAMPALGYIPARTRDGRWVQFANHAPHLFRLQAELLDLDGLLDEPEFAGLPFGGSPDARRRFWELVLERTSQRGYDELMAAVLAGGKVGMDMFTTTRDGMDHPQARYNGDVVMVEDPVLGLTEQIGPIARMSFTPSVIPAPVVANSRERPSPPRASGFPLPAHPLAGLLVLEAAAMYAAPYGPSLAADLGARVIKIEPLDGDPFRSSVPGYRMKTFEGKESLALDLKQPEAQAVVHRLAAHADAFVHNYRPGVAERLGCDEATMRRCNNRIVYLYAGAYGDSGPYARLPAYHPIGGAIAGNAVQQAGDVYPPAPSTTLDPPDLERISTRMAQANEGNPDANAALVVGTALCFGLLAARRFGYGQSMMTSMLAANAYIMSDDWIRYQGQPARPRPDADLLGFGALYRLYETAEGWVFLACTNDVEWEGLRGEMGLDVEARGDDDLANRLSATFRKHTADEWEARLLAAGVGCVRADGRGYIQFSMEESALRETGAVVTVRHPELGSYQRHAPLVSLSRTASSPGAGATLGQHTRAILTELGYDDDTIADLVARNVVRIAHEP
jgi:crotonobetainyl-CoA:carnitine CoA-transferase CaiB-like acyl-CoA transferase